MATINFSSLSQNYYKLLKFVFWLKISSRLIEKAHPGSAQYLTRNFVTMAWGRFWPILETIGVIYHLQSIVSLPVNALCKRLIIEIL